MQDAGCRAQGSERRGRRGEILMSDTSDRAKFRRTLVKLF